MRMKLIVSLQPYNRKRLRDYLRKESLNWLILRTYLKAIEYLTLDLSMKLRILVLIRPLRSQDWLYRLITT